VESRALTDIQERILTVLFDHGLGERGYYLTGGTALSEFYLQHRYSDDLDFFTRKRDALEPDFEYTREVLISHDIEISSEDVGAEFARLFVRSVGQRIEPLKIEFARDVPAMMAPVHVHGQIIVDSFEDIAVNKICAILNREPPEPKDFVDLLFILEDSMYSIDYLIGRAREKEAAFDHQDGVLFFATNLLSVREFQFLPRMIRPLTLEKLSAHLVPIARSLLQRIRPTGR